MRPAPPTAREPRRCSERRARRVPPECASPPASSLFRPGQALLYGTLVRSRETRSPARALLRPRLRLRAHAGHEADGGQPHLGGSRSRDAPARTALVGVGRLRVADELHPHRGGPRAVARVRVDGGLPGCRARRAARIRRGRAHLRGRVRDRALAAHLHLRRGQRRRRRRRGDPAPRSHRAARAGAPDRRRVTRGIGADRAVAAGARDGLRGPVVACGLWWASFAVVALAAESRFRRAGGHERALIARDSYSYLPLPMIAGIVLIALAVKKTIEHVDEPLKTIPAVALFGGVALYYAGHVGFRIRNVGSINRPRSVAVLVCLALIPLATEVDAGVALGAAALVVSAVIAWETIMYAEARSRIRGEHAGG